MAYTRPSAAGAIGKSHTVRAAGPLCRAVSLHQRDGTDAGECRNWPHAVRVRTARVPRSAQRWAAMRGTWSAGRADVPGRTAHGVEALLSARASVCARMCVDVCERCSVRASVARATGDRSASHHRRPEHDHHRGQPRRQRPCHAAAPWPPSLQPTLHHPRHRSGRRGRRRDRTRPPIGPQTHAGRTIVIRVKVPRRNGAHDARRACAGFAPAARPRPPTDRSLTASPAACCSTDRRQTSLPTIRWPSAATAQRL